MYIHPHSSTSTDQPKSRLKRFFSSRRSVRLPHVVLCIVAFVYHPIDVWNPIAQDKQSGSSPPMNSLSGAQSQAPLTCLAQAVNTLIAVARPIRKVPIESVNPVVLRRQTRGRHSSSCIPLGVMCCSLPHVRVFARGAVPACVYILCV